MYKDRISSAIQRYKNGLYTEVDFQHEVESIAVLITESNLYRVRDFLFEIEGELELINFTVNSIDLRDKYLEQIVRLEKFLLSEK